MEHFFILGAPDPEMDTIEALLAERGAPFTFATCAGKRVNPGTAYKADPVEIPAGTNPVWVECASTQQRHVVIDHHRPGDTGYGLPPENYWEASSIGQACALLGVNPTPELQLVAAADHCLAHAYAGQCPGVDPDELMRWRAETRAAFQRRPIEAVLADVERARRALNDAPKRIIAGVEVADFGDSTVPELPEAAARDGVPFVATVTTPDGRRKVGLMAAPPEVVRDWMASAKETLVDVYGDPERGFAGGYL